LDIVINVINANMMKNTLEKKNKNLIL